MTQNTSHAVMAQRSEPNDSLDDFPTPSWATRALMEHVIRPLDLACRSVWEPACNRGYMSRPLAEYFGDVHESDVHDYGGNHWIADFLFPGSFPNGRFAKPDFVISNPPFRLAEQFIARACDIATQGVAMLVRTSFLESVGRYERMFKPNPPSIVAQFVERVPMVRGRMDRTASTATSYCWLAWLDGLSLYGPSFKWIPPCRAKLERDEDYRSAAAIAIVKEAAG